MSFDVYKTQDKWIQVKEDMLATYIMHADNYYNTLYKAVGNGRTVNFEYQTMVTRLSPCNNNSSLWFTNFTCCPQIVADTYHRPVIVYTYSEFKLKSSEMNKVYQPQVFIPLLEMETKNRENPISLLLVKSHFYHVELARIPKRRAKNSADRLSIAVTHVLEKLILKSAVEMISFAFFTKLL